MDYENRKTATVMAVHRDRYELYAEEEIFYGRLKTALFYNTKEMVDFPTVGDEVRVNYNQSGDSQIIKILPRKTVFMRLNSTQGLPDQAVAANFDYAFITMSLNRDFHISKLERYLTVSWQSGATLVMRKLIVTDIEEGKEKSFEDIEELISSCKFSDCRHKSEPGCAVREALENGTLNPKHWKTYLDLQREEAYAKERKKVMTKRTERTRRDISRRR